MTYEPRATGAAENPVTMVSASAETAKPTAPEAPLPLHRALGVTDEELDVIRQKLGREPNHTELAVFSVMWSEHCSYKSSKPLLKTLPTRGSGMMAGIGDNAGVVRIGDGLAVAFKIESHNHPSAVEPYQGAATGVGGILRDIFTMGARPIAVLDALRFGDPTDPHTRHLVDGIVRGVGGYGNCVGVPTVGGELVFDPSYQGNPLVNVMAIGILEERMLILAEAPGPGNYVVLFGSTTGRDGIGGASVLASATFQDQDPSKRPAVQVGDPFAEKLLIEASLELIDRHLVVGIQDLGAGGISCATSESADKAGTGILLDLDAIPRREPGMAPWEIMISESQERMLATCLPENYPAVREVCERWGIPVALVGRVTTDGDIHIVGGGIGPDGLPNPGATEIARIPAKALTSDAIVHNRLATPPTRRRQAPAPGLPLTAHDGLPERGMDPAAVLVALLGSANLSSRHWVYQQYDSSVQSNTVEWPGHGAAVLRVKGTKKALVATTDGNQTVSAIDPHLGAQLSVAEATRNVSITGARPLGITNCLNYGNPERPEAFWQLQEAVRGMAEACRALSVAVTGGNVSLYNEYPGGAIAPTPEIGVVGLLEDISLLVGPPFTTDGDAVLLIGESTPGLAGSAYAALAGISSEDSPPGIDLEREAALQSFIREAIGRGLVASAQDVSGGGLAVALAECCMWSGFGARLRLGVSGSPAIELFGESPSRIVLSCRPRHAPSVELLARQFGLAACNLGTVGGDRLRIDLAGQGATGAAEERGSRVADALDVSVADLRHTWDHGLARALGVEPGPVRDSEAAESVSPAQEA
jgi:phosphoribosylformylglycinamidine synthase